MRFGQLQIVTSAMEPDEQIADSGHARYMSRCLHCKGEVATVKQVRHSNVFKCTILIVSYTKLLISVIDKALNCLSV